MLKNFTVSISGIETHMRRGATADPRGFKRLKMLQVWLHLVVILMCLATN